MNQIPDARFPGDELPRRVIRGGYSARPLPRYDLPLTALSWESGGDRVSVDDYMDRCRVSGLLVLKDGSIALERYGLGRTPESLWSSFSTAKSITSTLCGAALHDGAIGSLDDPCDVYLPRLRGSAYEGVTLRNVLRMCSGVAWDENAGARDTNGQLHQALSSGRAGALLEVACGLPRAHAQGRMFNYSTLESYLLGALIVAATGQTLSDYCAATIWQPAGMEADGIWLLDSENGMELGGFGVRARLRDIGRFAQLVLDDGESFIGRRVLPPGWRDRAGQPDGAPTAFGRLLPVSPLGYGYQWWSLPHLPTGLHAGAFMALGAFGQFIYIHPGTRIVVVIQSAWHEHELSEAQTETFALLRALVLTLRAGSTSSAQR